jgi:carbon storage regulator
MLVLTRKYQEKIRIGENITITVLRMKGKAVRLGIEAPADVPVIRGELSFAVEADAVEAEESESPTIQFETAEIGRARDGRTFARSAGPATQWTTQSSPDRGSRSDTMQSGGTVSFGRVPRDKVADLLPKLVSGAAPLRAMMDPRST